MKTRQIILKQAAAIGRLFSPPHVQWQILAGLALLILGGLSSSALAQERVLHTVRPGLNWETWRIEQPNVRQRVTEYPQIRFRPGDRITINAGGCVQTGGAGLTWKRYVDPPDYVFDCDRRYAGLVEIPGVTPGLMRVASLVGHPLEAGVGTYLKLGYEDDDYGDNGYWEHDDGKYNQCAGVGNAFVEITIVHSNDLLTGVWTADDGGIYYVRQVGGFVWWAGLSTESPGGRNDFQRGLNFTNVFQGRIAIHTNTVVGEWADVPRGAILQHGELTLDLVSAAAGLELHKRYATGGFGARVWRRSGLPTEGDDIASLFCRTRRNDGSSLAEWMNKGRDKNGGLYKDHVVVYGRMNNLPAANFPGNNSRITFFDTRCPQYANLPIPRSYPYFMCADFCPYKWFNGGWASDPPDGDINFDIEVEKGKLNLSPGPGWLHNPGDVVASLNATGNIIHTETIMYGREADASRCAAGAYYPTLLPGWADGGGNSVLVNGRPLNGSNFGNLVIGSFCNPFTSENSACGVERILGWEMGWDPNRTGPKIIKAKSPTNPGQRVRITGVLAFDGHAGPDQKVEVHPVYSIDFITASGVENLTGVWGGSDEGTYYMHQIGDTVWWLGLSNDRGKTFANVFRGTIQNSIVRGEWADITLGRTRNNGRLEVYLPIPYILDPSGAPPKPDWRLLYFGSGTGGFGGRVWEKLYEP